MAGELFGVEGEASSLWSGELAPTEPGDRAWSGSSTAPVWAAVAFSLPVYLLAGGMVALGMSVGAALGSVLLGSVVAAAIAIGCGHAGVRYGIPFAVLARTAFGVTGAKVPVALRLLVGCAWVGMGCWLGGQALLAMLVLIAPSISQATPWVCFVVFLVAVAAQFRSEWRMVVGVLLSACLMVTFVVAAWLEFRTRGIAVLAVIPSALVSGGWSPVHGVAFGATAALGMWLPVVLGASDTGRRCGSQHALVLGLCAMPAATLLSGGLAATVTALAVERGSLYWNPVSLAAGLPRPLFAFACLALVAAAALLTVRPICGWLAEQIAGLMPTRVTAVGGRWLVSLVAAICLPRRLVSSPDHFLVGWLTGSAGLLAPVAAIVLVEYFVLRRRWLNVDDLYQRDGLYEYSRGWNWKAFAALGAGWLTMLVVFLAPALDRLQDGAVWLGTGVSALLYWVLRSGPLDVAQIPPTPLLIPLAGFESEGASG